MLHALIPTRHEFNLATHQGTQFLQLAEFHVHILVGHSSIYEAYAHGVTTINLQDEDVVLLVHDDVHFHGLTGETFVRLLRRHLDMPGAGFVGVAGCRTLQHHLAWWRNASGATALAGQVYHGLDRATAERSFFGPAGRVAVLDGVILAATGRTMRSIRLDAPSGLAAAWHFYDVSVTLQAHFAGLSNVALPLGVYHGSKGKPDAAWEVRRARIDRAV